MDNRFSPLENAIIKYLGRRKKTLTEITNEVHTPSSLNGSIAVASAVRRINKKCILFELKWKLDGEGTGRHGRRIWRTKRGKR